MQDLNGKTFGELKVLRFHGVVKKNYLWECECSCGKHVNVSAYILTKKGQKRCLACANKIRAITHGHSINNRHTTTYNVWASMLHRAGNQSPKLKYIYGHVSVCERWRSFENFLSDMGKRPRGKTLDRINNNGNYEPSNCRWATYKQQLANRRPYRKRNRHLIALSMK